MDIVLTAFPAENGESILIELYGKTKTNILVDLGYLETYKSFVKKKLNELSMNDEKIDVLVLTHYDRDHIEGSIKFFEDLLINEFIKVEEIWVNDFISLCLNKPNIEKINKVQEVIYELSIFTMNLYGVYGDSRRCAKISKSDIFTITKLITKLGYNNKINKKFKNRIACIQECEDDNLITINNEIEIKILSPKKELLQILLHSFLKWLEKNRKFTKLINKEELYELFISNLDNSMKAIAKDVLIKSKTSGIGNYKEIIDSIINNKDKFADKSLSNISSIVFSLKFKNYNILFTGDTDCNQIINLISDNNYNLIKVSHHGSKNNTSRLFLQSIICSDYLICTDGSRHSNHPDLETLVYIAEKKNSNIYLNYPINELIIPRKVIEELKNKYNLTLNYIKDKNVNCMELKFKEGKILWEEANF